MTENDYLQNRIDDQINWYSKKSTKCQRYYKIATIICYIAAAFTTLLSPAITECPYIKYIISFLGSLIVVTNGIKNLCKWHDNWISYRYTSELLKQEKFMYLNAAGVYDMEATRRFVLFTERCETIISHETINWTNLNEKKKCTESIPSPR